MRVPNAEQAIIDPAKLRDYILSDAHPVGRFTAIVFRSLGYSQGNWEQVRGVPQLHGRQHDAVPLEESEYGKKRSVRGILLVPCGKEADIVSVWIVLRGETRPRFLTALPGAGK